MFCIYFNKYSYKPPIKILHLRYQSTLKAVFKYPLILITFTIFVDKTNNNK